MMNIGLYQPDGNTFWLWGGVIRLMVISENDVVKIRLRDDDGIELVATSMKTVLKCRYK